MQHISLRGGAVVARPMRPWLAALWLALLPLLAGASGPARLLRPAVGPPSLTTINPPSGPTGTSLTLSGSNLSGVTTVTFTSSGGTATTAANTYTIASTTSITGVVVPASLGIGAYTVTADNQNGTSNGLPFTVTVAPFGVSSFAPASGPAGTAVTFTGNQLDLVRGVRFGTGALTTNFVSQSATSLTVRVPVVSTTGVITLTNSAGASVSTATPFTYTPRPGGLVATLSPAGPLDVCQPRTLTASAASPAFATGTGFSGSLNSVVVQPDGKILVGGFITAYQGTAANHLVRLNPDGSRDASFAIGTGFDSGTYDVALQADGKILVGGSFSTYQGAAANTLVRLNPDGSRDASFAIGTGVNNIVDRVVVQPDGKVLVGGFFATYNGTSANNLVRLNPDGSRDASFAIGTGFNGGVFSIVMQADGKVLVGGGFTTYNGTPANGLVRLNPDGTLDASLATGTGFNGTVVSMVVQPDGKILAVGSFTAYNGTTGQNLIVRLNADGSRDASFVTGTGVNGEDELLSRVALQTDGKVLVGGGFATYNGTPANSLVRLNANGTPDASFATGTGFVGSVYALALQADSKVLVGGDLSSYNGTTIGRIARLSPTGSLNTTATPVAGASFTFSPGGTTTNPRVTSTPGSYTATASLNGETSAASNTVVLTACLTPVLSSISPSSGPVGSSVTLTGSNLTGATAVRFAGFLGNTVTTGLTVSGTGSTQTLTVTVPAGAQTGPVTVTTPSGTSNGVAFTLTVTAETWTGAVSRAWDVAGNWSQNTVPTGTISVTIPAGPANQPLVSSATAVCDNLTVQTGASLSLAAAAELTASHGVLLASGSALTQAATSELYIGTDWTNNGATLTLDPSSEVGFGFAPHYIYGSATSAFQILTLAERGSFEFLQLQAPVTVAVKLVLANNSVVNIGTGGSLTLLSTPTRTALVEQCDACYVNGPVTVQRAVTGPYLGAGYRHYSAPVSNATVATLATPGFVPVLNPAYNTSPTPGLTTPFPTVFGYDESRVGSVTNNFSAFDKGWYSPAALTDALTPGQGYTVQIAGSQTVAFEGTLNRNDLTLSLGRSTGPDAGWHLLGNPYPAPLDYALVDPTDRPGLDAAMYVFAPSGPYAGSYRAYLPPTNGNAGIGSSVLALGQGFFVRVSASTVPGSGSFTFRNAQRLTDESITTTFSRSTTTVDPRPLLTLALANATGGPADALTVYATAGATTGLEGALDAVKLPNPSGLNLASLTAAGEALAIDGRPALSGAVPLQVGLPAAGTYTLTAATAANLTGTHVELVDNLTGTRTLLVAGAAYTFSSATTTTPGRFWLNLTPAAAPLAAAAALDAQVLAYPNPTTGRLTVLCPAGDAASAVLYNGLGQVLRTVALPTAETTLDLTGLPAGVYVLRLSVAGQLLTRRVVLR